MEARLHSNEQRTTPIIYIDDIVTYSTTFVSHITRVQEVLQRIKDSGLKLGLEKCELFQTSVNFLWHAVSNKEMKPCPVYIQTIVQWKVTIMAKLVKPIGYWRILLKIYKEYAEIVKALTDLTKKGKKFA